MEKLIIHEQDVKTLLDTKYIKVYDLQYAPGAHYYDATRREIPDLVATKSEQEFQTMLPDAATCIVVLITPDGEPRLLSFYEYRYPTGQYVLSIPAGLIDEEDKAFDDAVLRTLKREIFEETGLKIQETDFLKVLAPLVFSSPGMTDESNALGLAIVRIPDFSMLNQTHAVGGERFSGFSLLTVPEAAKILADGRDPHGNFFSLFTWHALSYFVSGAWKAYL